MFESSFMIIMLSLFMLPVFNSPMILGLFLVVFSFMSGVSISAGATPWFFFLMVLVFTGGMMIMSLYIFSFSSLFKINHTELYSVVIVLGFISLFFMVEGLTLIQVQGLVDFEGVEMMVFILLYLLFVISLVIDLVLKMKGSFQG